MRIFVRSTVLSLMLAAGLLVFGAASASAYIVEMETSYVNGTELDVGDTVSMDVYFDTEGQSNVQLLSVSVIFDTSVFGSGSGAYVFDSPTYMFFVPVGRGFNILAPVGANNGNLRVGTSNQILLDWQNSDALPSGNLGSGRERMATITFTVQNTAGPALFELTATAPGNIFQIGPPTNEVLPITTTGNFVVSTVPEPTTAVLVGLGLLGLGLSGRRRGDIS